MQLVKQRVVMSSTDSKTKCSTTKNRKETKKSKHICKNYSVISSGLKNIKEMKSRRKETTEISIHELMTAMPASVTSSPRLQ